MEIYIQEILDKPVWALGIFLNLIIIESLLSVDNAAVLATMVKGLPKHQQGKALRYGILGAYFFRGLALVFASILMQFLWLKILGGIYLIFLAIEYFVRRKKHVEHEKVLEKKHSGFYRWLYKHIGQFWATVTFIEIMDFTFSIDNVFAVVAFTDNLVLIWMGVFLGILAMRFVAQYFVKLINKYPFLEMMAFLVISILGIKLLLTIVEIVFPDSYFAKFLTGHTMEWLITFLTLSLFLFPVLVVKILKSTQKNEN